MKENPLDLCPTMSIKAHSNYFFGPSSFNPEKFQSGKRLVRSSYCLSSRGLALHERASVYTPKFAYQLRVTQLRSGTPCPLVSALGGIGCFNFFLWKHLWADRL